MKVWEDRAIGLIKQNIPEFEVLDILQKEMNEADIFAVHYLLETRVNMAQQIINIVKGKQNEYS